MVGAKKQKMDMTLASDSDVSIAWNDSRPLGYGPLDEMHKEFYDVTLLLFLCDEANACRAITAFETHCIKHFGQEERWMHETEFPPRQCHIDEHNEVMKSVREVKAAWGERRIPLSELHRLAESLFQWFPGHADYLDSALAAYMSKKTRGGTPVVLRRTL